MALSLTVFEIFMFEDHCDLEIQVRGQSRSLKVVPFDSLPMVIFAFESTVTLKPVLGVI